jgi:biotin--protein ligase
MYEVVGDRSLKLSTAVATGSIVPGFEYNSERGARAVPVKLVDSVLEPVEDSSVLTAGSSNVANLYVNGGPWFRYPDNSILDMNNSTESVLAWYLPSANTLNKSPVPAIVETRVGRGKAILSGPHFEVSFYIPFGTH